MTDQIICPVCGSSLASDAQHCPYCNTIFGAVNRPSQGEASEAMPGSQPAPVQSPPGQIKLTGRNTQPLRPIQATPEALVPRLGDILVNEGLVSEEDIQRALALQEKRATVGRSLLLGEALTEMGLLERQDLDRVITRQLLSLHSALKEANRTLELRVQERTQDLENLVLQIRAAAEITQAAVSATSLDELLRRTVELLQQRFDFLLVSLFLPIEAGKAFLLQEAAGENAEQLKSQGMRIEAGSNSLVGWVAANKKPRLVTIGDGEFFAVREAMVAESRAEASIPILLNDQVVGILDVHHAKSYALDEEVLAILQTIGNHIASSLANIHLLETTRLGLKEISSLHKASQQIMQASHPDDILKVVSQTLSASEFSSIMFTATEQKLQAVLSRGLKTVISPDQDVSTPPLPPLPSLEVMRSLMPPGSPPLIIEPGKSQPLPDELAAFPKEAGWYGAVSFPIWCRSRLDGLFLLGMEYPGHIPQAIIQSFASLAGMASNALDKLYAFQTMQKRMEALQTMNTISQAVSVATDLDTLYRVIHNEVVRIIGDVDFLIAEYDARTNLIHISYMIDSGKLVNFDEPFPLGQGLVSILINSGQPLRLVENTEERAREMGAKILGRPAKSWLGVPLMVANEIVGAMVVQDLEHEFRFDEDDQLLLTTLGAQVAVALRNARLLDMMYHQAERERRLYEITNRIRSAADIQTILDTTSHELRKALNARHARVELGFREASPVNVEVKEASGAAEAQMEDLLGE